MSRSCPGLSAGTNHSIGYDMRDKWYFHLAVGWYKMTIAERGFVSTLYSSKEEFTASWEDADTIFGAGWKSIADGLVAKKVISVDSPSFGVFHFKLLLKNANRREYLRNYNLIKRTCAHTEK